MTIPSTRPAQPAQTQDAGRFLTVFSCCAYGLSLLLQLLIKPMSMTLEYNTYMTISTMQAMAAATSYALLALGGQRRNLWVGFGGLTFSILLTASIDILFNPSARLGVWVLRSVFRSIFRTPLDLVTNLGGILTGLALVLWGRWDTTSGKQRWQHMAVIFVAARGVLMVYGWFVYYIRDFNISFAYSILGFVYAQLLMLTFAAAMIYIDSIAFRPLRMGTGGKVWSVLCTVFTTGSCVVLIALGNPFDTVLPLIAVVGFVALLCGKRWGYLLIALGGLVPFFVGLNQIMSTRPRWEALPTAIAALLNPGITALIIRRAWQADSATAAAPQAPQQSTAPLITRLRSLQVGMPFAQATHLLGPARLAMARQVAYAAFGAENPASFGLEDCLYATPHGTVQLAVRGRETVEEISGLERAIAAAEKAEAAEAREREKRRQEEARRREAEQQRRQQAAIASGIIPLAQAGFISGGVCDVCNRSIGLDDAWFVPNNVFYASSGYRNYVRTKVIPMFAPGADVSQYLSIMRARDQSRGSAVCESCINLFP